jgi:hypothetical protein
MGCVEQLTHHTTSNSNAIANPRSLHFPAACTQSSQSAVSSPISCASRLNRTNTQAGHQPTTHVLSLPSLLCLHNVPRLKTQPDQHPGWPPTNYSCVESSQSTVSSPISCASRLNRTNTQAGHQPTTHVSSLPSLLCLHQYPVPQDSTGPTPRLATNQLLMC